MIVAIACALACSLFWAGGTIAGKMLTQVMPAFVFAFSRYLLASLCLLPFLSKQELKSVKVRHIPAILFLGLTIVLFFNLFFFTALSYTTATTVSLIGATSPMLTLFVTALLFRKAPKREQMIAFLLSFAGASMIITRGRMGFDILTGSIGEFLALAGILVQIAYALTLKRVSEHYSMRFLSFATGLSGILFLMPLVLNKELVVILQSMTSFHWALMAYVGTLGTAGGMMCYSLALKRMGPATTSLLVFSTMPIFVFFLAYFILGDRLIFWHALGGSLVIGSLILGLRHA